MKRMYVFSLVLMLLFLSGCSEDRGDLQEERVATPVTVFESDFDEDFDEDIEEDYSDEIDYILPSEPGTKSYEQ